MTFRACIVTNKFYHSHETMINYHIERLFGGNTVVACERFVDDSPFGKIVHALRGRRGLLYKMRRRWYKRRSLREHSTDKVLFGSDETALIRFLRTQAVDIAVSEFGTRAMTVAPAIQAAGIPHVAYFRGYDAATALRDPMICEAYRRMMPRLAGIVAVSQFLVDNLTRIGATHPNTHVIPSGVDTDWFRPAEKKPGSFLAVGRFVEKKRPDITIRAFAAVAAQDDRLHLDMIGDGVMFDACRGLAESLGMKRRITFHGALPHQQVAEHMARAQVFLQHSMTASTGDAEGVPTAIQEAMACGMVVVSTRHAGIPEILTNGVEGFLVDEGDEAAYAGVIARVARDVARLGEVAAAARSRAVIALDKAVLHRRFEDVLADAVQGPTPPAESYAGADQ